jgi:hypothetical protein
VKRCEDFPCCGHQIGECPTGPAKNCPDCGRLFVPDSNAEKYCYPCGQTPKFSSAEERDLFLEGWRAIGAPPKNLREVVYKILVSPGPGQRREPVGVAVIRDYLAQKFQVAILANPEATEALMQLYTECVGVHAKVGD